MRCPATDRDGAWRDQHRNAALPREIVTAAHWRLNRRRGQREQLLGRFAPERASGERECRERGEQGLWSLALTSIIIGQLGLAEQTGTAPSVSSRLAMFDRLSVSARRSRVAWPISGNVFLLRSSARRGGHPSTMSSSVCVERSADWTVLRRSPSKRVELSIGRIRQIADLLDRVACLTDGDARVGDGRGNLRPRDRRARATAGRYWRGCR